MSFKEKWNQMNRKANDALKNAKSRKAEQAAANNDDNKEKKPGTGKKVLRAIAAVILVGIIVMCIAGCVLTVWVFDTLNNDQQMLDLSMQKAKYTTIFYADDGETELARAYDPEAGNRIWVDYDKMPQQLLDAVVAVEDKRFWEHNGVDFLTTSKAGISAILQKIGLTGFYGGATPGASTITQQVVRNITNDRAVDGAEGWARKLREIFRALNVEKYYTKQQIIETYLNLASFSQNCSGIQAAANVFFNKDVSELTVAECATIVGTTKNPYAYDPYTHWEANQQRKEYILGLMLEQGKLTKEEYNAAISQEIVLATGTNSNATIQTWFVDYVTDEVCRDLAEKQGITEAEAYQNLISGGYRIYTTCEERVQDILEDYYASPDNFPAVNNEEYPQSAFVITDTNGAIKGIVGGNRGKEGNRIWNRASDTTRQIGSTIKPITSYVLGIEKDIITYSTVIEDRQVVVNPDEVSYSQPLWVPKNEYNSFKGFVTVRTAIIRSINTVAVQITQKLGTTTSYDFLKYSLNVDTLTAGDDSYSPMALGSLSKGMTLVKLAGAYQMFGNGGVRTEPYSYTRVEDTFGNVILEKNTVPNRVISAETATVMNRLLQEVTGSEGTGAAANLGAMNIPVAGKTGTTDDSVDQWFVGVTPYYVGVCWLGYDSRYQTDDQGNIKYYANGNPIPNSIRYSSYPPPKIWKAIMSQVHEGVSGRSFETSNNVTAYQYCKLTGMLAGDGCTETATGWYKNSNIPQVCSYHNYGSSYGIPLVGMTAAECGVEYADQYLNTAYALIQAYAKQGQVLSVKSAIEMARSGNIPYDMLYATEEGDQSGYYGG
ncbi:MAG TPA: hypothetical protein DCP22_00470 [Ruminococcaceae bacterium]|nr:hypothetical protein [Oscillospiraceae bacterium]